MALSYLQVLPACRWWQATDEDTEGCARAPVGGTPWWATGVATTRQLNTQCSAIEVIPVPGMSSVFGSPAEHRDKDISQLLLLFWTQQQVVLLLHDCIAQ
jgi:hypothetical protein